MRAAVGQQVLATLPSPPAPIAGGLGARIEVPVTRQIVAAWTPAVLVATNWTVVIIAPPTVGEYLLVWRTPDPEPPEYETFVPLTVTLVPDPDPPMVVPDPPSVADVAALLRARTRGKGDDTSEQGTFNAVTRPTGEQVTALIEVAARGLLARVANTIPAELASRYRDLVALDAATMIEASYYPDQLDSGRSPVRQYQAQYLTGADSLTAAAGRVDLRLT